MPHLCAIRTKARLSASLVLAAGLAMWLVILPGSGTAQTATQTPDADYQRVLENLLTGVVQPGLEGFARSTESLSAKIDDFCAAPDAAGLQNVQQGFHDAMDRWQEIQPWRMGPMVALGRDQHIEYWPDKHGTATRQFRQLLRSKPDIYIDRAQISTISAALQGFPALEQLLFDQGLAAQLQGGADDGPYLCAYAGAIAANLVQISHDLRAEWPEFADAMRKAGPDSLDYPDARFAAAELYRALHEGLLIISSQKLARPLGATAGDANAKRAESWQSQRSLRNIDHNLKALYAIYDGSFRGAGESGKGLVALIGNDLLDRSLRLHWHNAFADLDALPSSMVWLLDQPDGYDRLRAFADRIAFLTGLVENDVGRTTGLGGGFNSLDGD
ncbi:MAG: imelysin family protein [Pseudomonadota bacterium]